MKKLILLGAIFLWSFNSFASGGKEYASLTYNAPQRVIYMVSANGEAKNFPVEHKKTAYADAMIVLTKLAQEDGWKVVQVTASGTGTMYYLLERESE